MVLAFSERIHELADLIDVPLEAYSNGTEKKSPAHPRRPCSPITLKPDSFMPCARTLVPLALKRDRVQGVGQSGPVPSGPGSSGAVLEPSTFVAGLETPQRWATRSSSSVFAARTEASPGNADQATRERIASVQFAKQMPAPAVRIRCALPVREIRPQPGASLFAREECAQIHIRTTFNTSLMAVTPSCCFLHAVASAAISMLSSSA